MLRMPEVTGDSGDGVLAAWLVEEAARFDAAQTIAYVETDDELFSVEAGRPGLLLKTLVEPGTRVPPGTPIGILGEPWEQAHDLDPVLAELGVGSRERVTASSPWFEPAAEPLPDAPETETLTVVAQVAEVMPLEISPLLALADEPVRRGAHAADPGAGELQHHYLRARVRVDRLVALAAQLERPESSVTDLVVRAVAAAHRQVPQLAVAQLDGDRGATAGIPVSDPGRFGVEEAAPVVPAGQSAALAVGAILDEPVIDGGAVVPGKVMTLTLSVRPGRVDDVQASRWLAVLVALLERPEWLLD